LELKDRQVTVIGLGITGYYMALLARSLGARVTVTDIKQAGAFEQLIINELREKGIRLELGGHDENTLLNSDLVIPSPGVPLDIAPLRLAYSSGIPVVGELDILTELSNVPVIAVTGTNGKSTVTTFIGQLLKKAKKRVFVGGNLGTPPAKVLLDGKKIDFFVLEVSSFQLDLTKKFRPYIGILLNITADHLDRYESFEAYAASKLSIFKNQTDDDFAIVNLDDEIIQNSLIDTKAKVLGYTIKGNPRACVRVEMDRVLFRTPLVDMWFLSSSTNSMVITTSATWCLC
jgi:UDP-N-acetylmuramoylalanine--D-glutamate ligase